MPSGSQLLSSHSSVRTLRPMNLEAVVAGMEAIREPGSMGFTKGTLAVATAEWLTCKQQRLMLSP